jgi:hypothetical protein
MILIVILKLWFIYLNYINAGGSKTKEQFIQELVDLIG